MKKTLILFFGLIMFTTSIFPLGLHFELKPLCVLLDDEQHPSFAQIVRSPACVFGLDLTPEELLKSLKDNDITINPATDDHYEEAIQHHNIPDPIRDGRFYNVDGSFYYDCNDILFSFSENNALKSIMVQGKRFTTTKGIKAGDSVKKVEDAYKSACSVENLTYRVKGGYIVFYVDVKNADKIGAWRICRELLPGN